jgi:predicted GIY-YIG superfamily endonuclease
MAKASVLKKDKVGLRRKRKHRSTKGALIKGMSGRLPSEILDSNIFEKGLQQIMQHYAGIYALYRKKKLYYVGLTKNLAGRLKSHLNDRLAGKWDQFMIFRIQRVRYLKDIETLIHHIVDMKGIKVKGKLPKDADLNQVLRDVLNENKKVIKATEKVLNKR